MLISSQKHKYFHLISSQKPQDFPIIYIDNQTEAARPSRATLQDSDKFHFSCYCYIDKQIEHSQSSRMSVTLRSGQAEG
jgi:hypothetical protein